MVNEVAQRLRDEVEGAQHPTDKVMVEAAHEIDRLSAKVKALEDCLVDFMAYGCPQCSGDCSSANPPNEDCPMVYARDALIGGDNDDEERKCE